VGLALAVPAARADWDVGDPHKMHFPQLPDPLGWDVAFAWTDTQTGELLRMSNLLADDWQCSQTGPVNDVHFWVSMQGDFESSGQPPFQINAINVTFWNDDPATAGIPDSYSMPDREAGAIRTYQLGPTEFSLGWWGPGPQQGWFNPGTGQHVPPGGTTPDHLNIYQINIPDLREPFIQEQGKIYWLELDVWATLPAGDPAILGWKTADLLKYPPPHDGKHFQDDAVFMTYTWVPGDTMPGFWQFGGYQELILPPDASGISRDLAFVITPEPATLVLMGLGLGGLVLRRIRRK
jgi:hypothetical protein